MKFYYNIYRFLCMHTYFFFFFFFFAYHLNSIDKAERCHVFLFGHISYVRAKLTPK